MWKRVALLCASLACGCTRLNPAYGHDGAGGGSSGASTTSGGSIGSTSLASGDASTAAPGREPTCEEPGFEIDVTGLPACPPPASSVVSCVALTDSGGDRLRGTLADCDPQQCAPRDEPFELEVGDVELPAVYEPLAEGETRCVWVVLRGEGVDVDACTIDRVEIWELTGALLLAVGNGPPDLAPTLARPLANPIPIDSSFHGETACGELSVCDRSGFRKLVVGGGTEAALPDGIPVPAVIAADGSLSHSVFNWGLQWDLGCRAWGRWAVVPREHEALFQ